MELASFKVHFRLLSSVLAFLFGYGYGWIRFLEAPAMSEQFSRRHRLTGTPALPDNAGTPAAWSATGESTAQRQY